MSEWSRLLRKRRAVGAALACGVVLCCAAEFAAPALRTGSTARVSVGMSGGDAHGQSANPSISANGRFVAFESYADDVVPGDENGFADVFVRDVARETTVRVSLTPSGDDPNDTCFEPVISANGRWVAFASGATNLVPGAASGTFAVYLRNLRSGAITRVSSGLGGAEPDGPSFESSLSADGRYVAFLSHASNLVEGDTNGSADVFVYDRKTRRTVRASTDSSGGEAALGATDAPRIAAGGRYVVFGSESADLVEGDLNASNDCFVKDLRTGRTTRVSLADGGSGEASGSSFSPQISSDGRRVAFKSVATGLVSVHSSFLSQLYLRDVRAETTRRISGPADDVEGNGLMNDYFLSPDGRRVVFTANSDNLVAGDTNQAFDVFVYDVRRGTHLRASVGPEGRELDGNCDSPSLSADGRILVFHSFATNAVADDRNGEVDVFVVRLR